MQVDIRLGNQELEPLRVRIQRQLDFKIASLRERVNRLEVNLDQQLLDSAPKFTCTMYARLQDGQVKIAQTGGEHPNVCIADAAARLARSVSRETRIRRVS